MDRTAQLGLIIVLMACVSTGTAARVNPVATPRAAEPPSVVTADPPGIRYRIIYRPPPNPDARFYDWGHRIFWDPSAGIRTPIPNRVCRVRDDLESEAHECEITLTRYARRISFLVRWRTSNGFTESCGSVQVFREGREVSVSEQPRNNEGSCSYLVTDTVHPDDRYNE